MLKFFDKYGLNIFPPLSFLEMPKTTSANDDESDNDVNNVAVLLGYGEREKESNSRWKMRLKTYVLNMSYHE